jgi:hypothetical protein
MSRAPNLRRALGILIMAWAGASGCIHNHYYGTGMPGCPPIGQPVTTQVGSICDVPTGQVIVSNPSSSRTISSNVTAQPLAEGTAVASNGQPRVVISQPAFGPPSIGQSTSRLKWRRPDPESLATTKVEGGLDDTTLR